MPPATAADVAVVGAGPAGTAAAITLARAGRRVVVVDRAYFPRDKCCGDGLTSAALRHLEALGLDPAAVASWTPVDGVEIRTPNGRHAHFDLPPGPGQHSAVARRTDLDAALVGVARAAGADVREGVAAGSVDIGPPTDVRPVHLEMADGSHLAVSYVLAADGIWSPVRKMVGAGVGTYLGDWHAARQYWRDTGPEALSMWVWFEEDLLPGYAWSFPLPGGGVNIGLGVHRHRGRFSTVTRAIWDDVLARPHISRVLGPHATPEGPWKAWPIPTRIGASPLGAAGGRVLFVGDAARSGDTMTGEGIAQALESAILAARAVIGAGPGAPRRALRTYRLAVAGGLGADDVLARAITRAMSHTRAANGWLPVAEATAFGRRHFGPWMFEHSPRALVLTPHRWRRGALSAPGAYAGPGAGAQLAGPAVGAGGVGAGGGVGVGAGGEGGEGGAGGGLDGLGEPGGGGGLEGASGARVPSAAWQNSASTAR